MPKKYKVSLILLEKYYKMISIISQDNPYQKENSVILKISCIS